MAAPSGHETTFPVKPVVSAALAQPDRPATLEKSCSFDPPLALVKVSFGPSRQKSGDHLPVDQS